MAFTEFRQHHTNIDITQGIISDNRHHFNPLLLENLEQAINKANAAESVGTLLKISITNLPTIVTWYNYHFTEQLMIALLSKIKALLPDSASLFRTAFEEFDIVLHTSALAKKKLVEQFNHIIQDFEFQVFTRPMRMMPVIGSVDFPLDAATPLETIAKSYIALDSAKNREGSFYCDYRDAEKQQLHAKNQIMLLHYMQDAVKQDRLRLAFQPVIDSKNGSVEFYECLLRIIGEDGRLSSAGSLIPIAEQMGFIDIVDRLVLEKVINELMQAPDVVLSFNISNRTTDNLSWLEMCRQLIPGPEVASRMIVEITETMAQRNLSDTAYFVASLQAIGCQVALDDFCAGYTSFRQLKNLSVDMVKIDGSFTKDLVDNSDNRLFVKTLLDFTHAYGLKTIAECIETGECAKILMDLNIDFMQGYYFGRPEVRRPWIKNVK